MIVRECVYEVLRTDQGEVLIAECVANRKVVAIFLLNDDFENQMEELHDAYPTVNFVRGSPTHSNAIVQAINNLDSTVEIDAIHNGKTEFGMRVYSAIRKIPKGETRSYSDIAREIGDQSAARAVASACARNNLAYIVPCHRVIGSAGNLSGYRWGIDKKLQLLQAERAELRYSAM